MRGPVLAALCLLCASASASAVQVTLDRRAVDDAIFIGQSRLDAERTRFHVPYRIVVARPPVDYVDVVTPFRRVVLAAEGRARIGDRLFGQREALAILDTARDRLEVLVEMTFHPLNTFIGVPGYDVTLIGAGGVRVMPLTLDRVPRFGPRVEGAPSAPAPIVIGPVRPGASQPMLGGTIVAQFDLAAVNPIGSYEMLLSEAGTEIVRATVDLAKLR